MINNKITRIKNDLYIESSKTLVNIGYIGRYQYDGLTLYELEITYALFGEKDELVNCPKYIQSKLIESTLTDAMSVFMIEIFLIIFYDF